MAIFNETLTGICFGMTFIFDFEIDEDSRTKYGYALVGMAASVLAVNMGLVIIITVIMIKEMCKNYWKKRKQKQLDKQNEFRLKQVANVSMSPDDVTADNAMEQ